MKKEIILLIMSIIFLSCKSEKKAKPSILLQHYFTDQLSSGIDDLTKEVNSSQDNFRLISTPMEHEEFKVSIRTQLESPNPPNLFSYWAGARTKYLVDSDRISPISDIFNGVVDPRVFNESVLNACSYNGEIYLLPITRHFVGFFYNKALFDEYGISVPENWDDFLRISNFIKSKGVTPIALGAKNRWPAQFWFDYILLRTSGYEFREQLMNNEVLYTNPRVVKAVEVWKDLIDRGYFGQGVMEKTWDEAALDVVSASAAMTLMGTWIIPTLESKGLKADEGYGFFSFPVINPEYDLVALGPIDGVLLSKGSKNKELSKEVLTKLTISKTQEAFNLESGAIAPHVNVSSDIYNPIQLRIKDIIERSSNWSFNYDLASTPIVSEAGLNFFVDFLNSPSDYNELLKGLDDYIESLKDF